MLETLKQHTSCYNVVARYGWEKEIKNGVELHRATYYDLRDNSRSCLPNL